jgi:hypothetical protein
VGYLGEVTGSSKKIAFEQEFPCTQTGPRLHNLAPNIAPALGISSLLMLCTHLSLALFFNLWDGS